MNTLTTSPKAGPSKAQYTLVADHDPGPETTTRAG